MSQIQKIAKVASDPRSSGRGGIKGALVVYTGGSTPLLLTKTDSAVDTAWSDITSTIGAGTISLSEMANLAASTVIGRNTQSTGVPEAVTMAQLRALLATELGSSYSFAKKTSSQSFSSATPANVTGLLIAVTSGHLVRFCAHGIVQTTNANTGVQLGITTPAFTRLAAIASIKSGGTDAINTLWTGLLNSSGDVTVPANGLLANTDYPFSIDGFIVASANGNVQIQMASETGTENVSFQCGVIEAWDFGV